MQIVPTALDEVVVVEPTVFADGRGFFMESWNQNAFDAAFGPTQFVQDNHSRSSSGVLRGIHYQLVRPQGKLVRVVAGTVIDVVVDLRVSSPSFKKWIAVELSGGNARQLWVPPGFGHGFLVMSNSADLVYKVTEFFDPDLDRTLRWDDPELAIEWPLSGPPDLSSKDRAAPFLADADLFA